MLNGELCTHRLQKLIFVYRLFRELFSKIPTYSRKIIGHWSGDGETGRVKLGGGNREGEWGKGQQEGEDREGGKREGRRRGMRRGDFTDGYDEMPGWTYGMPGWNEVTEFSDFVYPCNAGYAS